MPAGEIGLWGIDRITNAKVKERVQGCFVAPFELPAGDLVPQEGIVLADRENEQNNKCPSRQSGLAVEALRIGNILRIHRRTIIDGKLVVVLGNHNLGDVAMSMNSVVRAKQSKLRLEPRTENRADGLRSCLASRPPHDRLGNHNLSDVAMSVNSVFRAKQSRLDVAHGRPPQTPTRTHSITFEADHGGVRWCFAPDRENTPSRTEGHWPRQTTG
ncbi:hypothetical protein B0H16DRAFT_1689245 [Mycena metata]|uniref:Uncharacterized protein n=1 Tax=Mycena metata TaxID=1033252 RepID=A0AAD7J7B2_9AGAR|nr:hypothetical protein B0H16DRAFT_1689245 [Mycena metata]